jgi:hypothetical protein
MADRRSASSDDTATSSDSDSEPSEQSDPEADASDPRERPDDPAASATERPPEGKRRDPGDTENGELASLRRAVEDKYDFEEFGPEEMAEMSFEEWEAAFDPDSWITGDELLDRVDADLRNRIAGREVFARIERLASDPTEGEPPRLLAYSDEGYALVYPDGSVDGRGTVLRDVKPTVALCSMDEYTVEKPPEGGELPVPSAVPEGSGELGNFMLQVVAAIQLIAGVGLFVAWLGFGVDTIFAPVVGFVFVLAGIFLFLVVANARLSDRFRAEEYRDRLRAVGLESGERPDFLPIEASDSDEESDTPG